MGERLIQVWLFFLRFSLRRSLHLRLFNTITSACYAICVTPYVGWVCCWFSPLLREVFLRVLRFSPLLKNQHFQIPIRPASGRRRTTSRMCYLQIIIYLFIYLLCFLFAALRPDHIPLANLQIVDHQTSLSDHDRPSDPTQNQTTTDHRQTRPPNQITPPDITDHQPWLLGFQSAQHTQPFELVQVRCILHGLGQGGYIELWMNLAKHTFHTLSALRLRNSFFSALLNCS